jgi:heat shock transcription factor 2
MVDTCNPEVASWSEDGETFVVKDPIKFERAIIPQFFKHSKFSSFVRVSEAVAPYRLLME